MWRPVVVAAVAGAHACALMLALKVSAIEVTPPRPMAVSFFIQEGSGAPEAADSNAASAAAAPSPAADEEAIDTPSQPDPEPVSQPDPEPVVEPEPEPEPIVQPEPEAISQPPVEPVPEPVPEPTPEPPPEPPPETPTESTPPPEVVAQSTQTEPESVQPPAPKPVAKPPRPKVAHSKPKPRQTASRPSQASAGQSAASTGQSGEASQAAVDMPASSDAAWLNNKQPEYPRASRKAGHEGTVTLLVTVGADGSAKAVRLHASSGFTRLDESALRAVRAWRFVPAMRGGKPVQSDYLLRIVFQLKP